VDLRRLFIETSAQLVSEFEKTAQIAHRGGQGAGREDAFRRFLEDYLPARYKLAQGEIISADNRVSRQSDVVIYDAHHSPRLLPSEGHSIFPIESIYGTIEVKSELKSDRLKEAYENIASVKELAGREKTFRYGDSFSFMTMHHPLPVGIVVAYACSRSLEAVAEQARELDSQLSDKALRPDLIAILGQGVIGPSSRLRGDANEFALPKKIEDLSRIRKTGRLTLLRTYLQLLDELNTLKLRPLVLQRYLRMPELVDRWRVLNHDRFMSPKTKQPTKLGPTAIAKIIEHCSARSPVTYRELLAMMALAQPLGISTVEMQRVHHVYNPLNRPPMDPSTLTRDEKGFPQFKEPYFAAHFLVIDDESYAVDLTAFDEADWIVREDITADEFFAE
jgi:hypothetical protein